MPRTPMDYSKTIIYKIVCNDLTNKDCYIGHTTNMAKRKHNHKYVCNNENDNYHNNKLYKIIRQNGGWSNWTMVLVETFPCKDNHEACKRQRELYEELGANMNRIEADEELDQYNKEYRDERELDLKQKQKHYREANKDYYKDYQKKYREEHREEKQEYHKEYNQKYYQKNKAEIIEKYKQKIKCEFCNKLQTKWNMRRHMGTCKSKPKEEN